MFLHWVRFPFHAKFDMLEYYGFGRRLLSEIEIPVADLRKTRQPRKEHQDFNI